MIDWPRLSKGRFVALLVVGLVARILYLTYPGTGDLKYFSGWALGAADVGVVGVFPDTTRPPVPEVSPEGINYYLPLSYPPGTAWYMGAVGWFARHVFNTVTPGALGVLVKIPVILAEALIAALLWRMWRRRRDESAARLAALGVWLNPALILSGSLLGYQDMVAAAIMLASLIAAIENRPVLALSLGVVTVLTKQLGLFYLPVLVTVVLMQAPTRRVLVGSLAAGASAAVILWPWAGHDAAKQLVKHLVHASVHRSCSANAMNAWWLWTYRLQDSRAWTTISGLIDCTDKARLAGVVALIVFTAWNLLRLTNEPTVGRSLLAAAMQSYVYATVAIAVHENHILWALPALAAIQLADRRLSVVYWAVSGVAFANLALFYGFGFTRIDRDVTGIDTTVLGAVAAVLVAGYVLRTVFAKDLFRVSLEESVAQPGALFDGWMARLGQAAAERRA